MCTHIFRRRDKIVTKHQNLFRMKLTKPCSQAPTQLSVLISDKLFKGQKVGRGLQAGWGVAWEQG